ncbi:hypothetical protein AB1A81_12215 [Bdellovibrio bacteriovorus]|uniref:hypothetical protein n=2 Tax=Bdellovibrio bacteriovorus TaxID=959 RepID=UPI00059F354F|nr:hypothetical protein [Bdellovibrio bacteriovorus]
MKKLILAVLLMSSASAFGVSSESRLLGSWYGLGLEMEYSIDGTLTTKSEIDTESMSCKERPVELADLKSPAAKGTEVVLDCKNTNGNKESYLISYYTSANNESCMTFTDARPANFVFRHLFCRK